MHVPLDGVRWLLHTLTFLATAEKVIDSLRQARNGSRDDANIEFYCACSNTEKVREEYCYPIGKYIPLQPTCGGKRKP